MSLNIALIADMITQDAAALAQLKELLARERIQLEQRKTDELTHIIEQKAILLDQLNSSAKQRQEVLKASDLPTNAAGWDMLLEANSAPEALRTRWQQLTQSFVECQEMNDINGKMISRSQQTLSQLLNLLRGKTPSPSLYNAHGAKAQTTASYTLAKA